LADLKNSIILKNSVNSLIWFSNLNLGPYLLAENEASPSKNPPNQYKLILISVLVKIKGFLISW